MSKARDLANAGTALTTVSATELGYVDGVTSAIQTQIDSKIGQSTAINPTIVDAKGDIIAATAADTVARLAVGANDTVLTADSAEATGLKWATVSGAPDFLAGKNKIINGNFNVWQRGTSFNESATSFYTADRWQVDGQTTGRTYSRQTTSDTTNLPNIQYCLRVQRTATNTTTTRSRVLQPFESVNSIPFAGKTITLSFYARAGSNYSAASSALGYTLYSGTGTDENPRTGSYTGQTLPLNSTTAITTTWARYSFSATLPTNCSEITPMFYADWVGTAGTNDYFEITGVQIEAGSTATPFSIATGSIATELAACQRYAYVPISNGYMVGFNNSTTQGRCAPQFPVTMRTAPTATYGTWGLTIKGSSGLNSTSVQNGGTSVSSAATLINVSSGLTAGEGNYAYPTNNSTIWSAEL